MARPRPTNFGRLRAPPDSGTKPAGTATSPSLRLVGGVAHVAGGGEFEPDADRGAVDRGDGDLRQLFELADGALDDDVAQIVEEIVRQLLVGAEVAEIVLVVERAERGGLGAQIAAGREAAALAGDDDDAEAVVAADLVEQEIELDPHADVDGVERLRTVERDEPDAGVVRLRSAAPAPTISVS